MIRVNLKLIYLILISIAFVVVLAAGGRIPQDIAYYNFADKRMFLGIPNFLDVISNMAFLFTGLYGLRIYIYGNPSGCNSSLKNSYLVFFTGTLFIAPGSAYFHLDPGHFTLVWDRIPMTFGFMGFCSIIAGEYISEQLGKKLLVPLLLFGIFSIIWWRLTDNGDGGDLRIYFIVQFLPILLIPVIILTSPAKIKQGIYVWGLLAMYIIAKIFEVYDESVYLSTGLVSGHTLKHLAAAIGIFIYSLGLTKIKLG